MDTDLHLSGCAASERMNLSADYPDKQAHADFLRTDQEQFLVQWDCVPILYDGYLSDVARNTVQGNDLASEAEKPVATA
jgi:hypothetical protein